MFHLVVLVLAQLGMTASLRLVDPQPGRWYEIGPHGVGTVVEVEGMLVGEFPVLDVKLGDNNGAVRLEMVSDSQTTAVSCEFCEKQVEESTMSLSGLESVRLVLELQSEGIFVDLVGVGSVMLPYPAESWTGNQSTAWKGVADLSRVYVGGHGVQLTMISGHVLVF